ncbi:hypothetical protein P3381_24275, partial [Vibrio parahaemolyticus]|nr:hypothetical protein [Vibrio parahaemolyticus]
GSKLHDYRISLFLCSEVSHFVLESKAHNKQFKRDSQRLAFLLLLQIKCLWHNALSWVVALLTP